jgi:hypothetical protein
MTRTTHPKSEEKEQPSRFQTTLLDLVRALGEVTDDEQEIVATVMHMVRTRRVHLIGSFRGPALLPSG